MSSYVPYVVVDLHCDTADRLAWDEVGGKLGEAAHRSSSYVLSTGTSLATNEGHISLKKMGQVPWAQCFACFEPDELSPEQAVWFLGQVFDHLESEVEKNAPQVTVARHAREIRPALEAGKKVAILTIENARNLATDPEALRDLAARGLLMASLSWNARGPLASGHADEDAGVTPLGGEVLRIMQEERVIVDVSHLNDRCFDDVCRLVDGPFVASHSNSRAVCGHPRNLTDAQFECICERGGIVGLNYCRDFLVVGGEGADIDAMCRHVEHWLDLGGEDSIALGSDFDGCQVPDCVADASKMPSFQAALEARFGQETCAKLCGQNALVFFERWGR